MDLGAGYADFAGSGVVHSVGAITALAAALIVGPRIGKYNRDGSPNAMPGHDIVIVLTGCFILAFGWFGFNPGSTLGASGALAHQRLLRWLRCWPDVPDPLEQFSTCGSSMASLMPR